MEKRLRRRPIHSNNLDGGSEAAAKRQNRPSIKANPAKACRGENMLENERQNNLKMRRRQRTRDTKGAKCMQGGDGDNAETT